MDILPLVRLSPPDEPYGGGPSTDLPDRCESSSSEIPRKRDTPGPALAHADSMGSAACDAGLRRRARTAAAVLAFCAGGSALVFGVVGGWHIDRPWAVTFL